MRRLFVSIIALLFLITSCNQGGIDIYEEAVILHKGENHTINATSKKPITYKSLNEYNATVANNGVVTANFVGGTTIILETEKDSKRLIVQVDPVSNLYKEPEFHFGIRKSSVIEIYGEPDEILNDGNADMYIYFTKNEKAPILGICAVDGYVVEYAVYVEYSEMMELSTFIEERYNFLTSYDGTKYYIKDLTPKLNTLLVGKHIGFYDDDFKMYIVVYSRITGKSDNPDAFKDLLMSNKDIVDAIR